MTKYSAATALALTVQVAAATAQDSDQKAGTINQVQFGDVWSNMDVEVPGYAPQASTTATTVGNNATAQRVSGDVSAEIQQDFDAEASAVTRLRGYIAETAVSSATAYGNAASGGTDGSYNDYRAQQSAAGDVRAESEIGLRGAGQVASATTAIANVSSTDNNFGTNAADQSQTSSTNVTATTRAAMYGTASSGSFATTAGANATSATGYTSTNYNRARQTTEDGSTVTAGTDVTMQDGTNVTAMSNGFGNSATVHNEWGYATHGLEGAPSEQANAADIDARSDLTLDNWSGYAVSSAYGVGNSALISNLGSDTAIHADQSNSGTVSSQASFSGGSLSGGAGSVSATSIGNAATATVCTYCADAAVSGRINQVNSGQTSAYGRASVSNGGAVSGAATAIGNSATLQSTEASGN